MYACSAMCAMHVWNVCVQCNVCNMCVQCMCAVQCVEQGRSRGLCETVVDCYLLTSLYIYTVYNAMQCTHMQITIYSIQY